MNGHELLRLVERSFIWHIVGDLTHQLFRSGGAVVLVALAVLIALVLVFGKRRMA